MAKEFDPTMVNAEGIRYFTVPSGEKVVVDENNRIETSIVIGLDVAVNHNLEGFLDLISEMATDTCLLGDFSYNVTGVTPEGDIILKVNGDISMIEEWNKDEEENNV